jgi:hypothetical protein
MLHNGENRGIAVKRMSSYRLGTVILFVHKIMNYEIDSRGKHAHSDKPKHYPRVEGLPFPAKLLFVPGYILKYQ